MLLKVLLPKSATCKTQNRALIAGIDSLKKQISMRLLNNCYQHFLITFGLESDSHLPKKLFYSLQRKPFKIDRNTFYFILKALFVFKYLSFREDFLAMQKKWLYQSNKVNSKIYNVTVWLTISINILRYISQS